MGRCCGKDMKTLCEQLDAEVQETQNGFQINITSKDKSKTEALKALVKACRDFCGCC